MGEGPIRELGFYSWVGAVTEKDYQRETLRDKEQMSL